MKQFWVALVLWGVGGSVALADEEARFRTFDGLELTGSWMLPAERLAPRGMILILQGSGNVSMDGNVSGPFVGQPYRGGDGRLSLQLAQALAGSGFSSFRYHKRGFEDPAQLGNQTQSFLVQDARSALAHMRGRYPGLRTGVAGFSEGALVAVQAGGADALFLLGLPSRPVDEMLDYQFARWPVELLIGRLDGDRDSSLSASELEGLGDGVLPLMGIPWAQLDADADGALQRERELTPGYESFYAQVRGLLATPAYKYWYEDLRRVPPIVELAQGVTGPIYFYHGADDAQTRATWVGEDSRHFASLAATRVYPGLGHCFSPMEGLIGQVKTSGPFATDVVDDVIRDVARVFDAHNN